LGALGYLWINLIGTLLRVFPIPCETGLVEIGHPDRSSPVLLTSNFRLTVERVKRSLRGVDAYLLVANGRGVNVWCAATGGLLTTHDVVTVIKTSGIEDRVDHRQLICPQLAATGLEADGIHERTGWRVVWGPVEAASIRAFLDRGLRSDAAMRTVRFPWPRRIEMGIAWAFPISLAAAALAMPFWSEGVLGLVGLIWVLSLVIFLAFPLYARWLRRRGTRRGFVFFDFGERGALLLLWACFVLALVAYAYVAGRLEWEFVLRWSLVALAVLVVLSIDLMGSTPTYKSGLHPDRLFRIVLDEEQCRAVGSCEDVCPTGVFEVDPARGLAILRAPDDCVQCGACIVQCPYDALFFQRPDGKVVSPETVRRFKLNLLGKRAVPDRPAQTD
jgi:NAD-dependent dihydropyrimidine dehydrogenase PreA subunit